MAGFIQDNWLLVVILLVLAALLLVWLLLANRRTRVEITAPAEDAPARRNQALIDAPPAAPAVPPVAPAALGGVGEAVVSAAAPAPVTGNAATADDLSLIKGVGPKLVAQLNALGVTELSQIAAWSEADIDRIDAQLGRFAGRIRRDDWRGQAALLMTGDRAAYEAKFGKL